MTNIDALIADSSLAVENERLRAELRARLAELRRCRRRLVGAVEAERRRIERDLHDSTQGRLVSLAMSLGFLEAKLPADPVAAKPLARAAREAVVALLDELRELSQGIYPSVLAERGLGAALEELCERTAVPAALEVSLDHRLSMKLEAAAYFVASEALTNVTKHSHAIDVQVRAWRECELLVVEVRDDGIGGASINGGSSLTALIERIRALSGRLLVWSPCGAGTMVRAELPCL